MFAPVSAPLSCKNAPEKTLHGVPGRLAHFRLHVAVRSEREGNQCMTEHLTHHSWLDTFEQQERGRGVAKVMRPDVRQPCLQEHGNELLLAEVGL